MELRESLLGRAVTSGTVAGITSALAASIAGRRETGSYAAPLNATSHIVWGDEAATHDEPSLKYTLTGFLLNHGSAILWGALFSQVFDTNREKSALTPLVGAAAVTAGAYITDYYLVPKRFTPGFEKRVSGRSMATIYGALALGLAVSSLIGRRS
ncbi:hypothetical protein E4K72_18400 [Oxalobacteraceae bacterium OM1]|nr:hypothetical protein E4K72_18400 [Oxalobacteraceae bacterium OM1]